ncbi:MAG: response regulator transcription factor [Rhodospirillaceae bacterium]|jgi:two-component system, NarL family, nitrate/nitrite response regulator NarL|nr:response regulator transcription factor [Rhodospirillaceae bacterium]MBT6406775.1 response regulator transcription factor [Rhodospirillaceae bacterium]MBT7356426.1 response regulator transcription factor [Rhodospirillaceae bacterium]
MDETEKETIDIVIADKAPLIQGGLANLFDNDDRFTLIATAADGERFLEAVRRMTFDVGIIGWDMPYLDGRGVLKSLRNSIETTPRIIVFTGNASPDVPRQVMQLGGAGFCSKSESPERLIETVLAVSEGRMVFPFMDMSKPGGDPFGTLTKREQELLSALAEGRTNGQIAEDLGISLNTVKFHLKNLYGKLSVRNRAQAVATFLTAHRP